LATVLKVRDSEFTGCNHVGVLRAVRETKGIATTAKDSRGGRYDYGRAMIGCLIGYLDEEESAALFADLLALKLEHQRLP
jgi:hypothetical protein